MDGSARDVDVMVVIGTEAGLGWRRAELQCQRAPLLDWCSGRHGTCAARGADRTPCHSPCNTEGRRRLKSERTGDYGERGKVDTCLRDSFAVCDTSCCDTERDPSVRSILNSEASSRSERFCAVRAK